MIDFNAFMDESNPYSDVHVSTQDPIGSNGGFGGGLTEVGVDVLGGVLGIDLIGNISNVFQYGLSSWGASTTPEKSQAKFQNVAVAYVQNILAVMNESNLTDSLNHIEKYLTFIEKLEQHKLRDHTRAKSTKLGREYIVSVCQKLRSEIVGKAITQLRSKGATVTSVMKRELNSEITFVWSSTDNSFHGDKGYDYKEWTIEIPKSVFSNPAGSVTDSLTGEDNTVLSEAGAGVGGLITLALGYFAFKKFM